MDDKSREQLMSGVRALLNRWARLNWWRCTKSNQLNPEDFAANWQQAMDWNGTVRMQGSGKPSGGHEIDWEYMAELERRKQEAA